MKHDDINVALFVIGLVLWLRSRQAPAAVVDPDPDPSVDTSSLWLNPVTGEWEPIPDESGGTP